jgi:predicted ATPase
LMIVEDAHWIDPTSHEALELIIDHIAGLRVMLILTYRPEFITLWVSRPQVTCSLLTNTLPPSENWSVNV